MGTLKTFTKKFLIQAILFIILFVSLTLITLWTISIQAEPAYFFMVVSISALIIGLAWCKILKLNKRDTLLMIIGGIIVITLMGAVFFSSLPINIKGHLIVLAALAGVIYVYILTKLKIISKQRWD